nr:MaoC family dehydratase [Dactylosporangium thailandense]
MGEAIELPESFRFTVRSRGRTITEGDFSLMTNLTWTTSEIHTNKVLMADSPGGERLLAGACVLAFALGLSTPAIKPELEALGVRLIALVGYDNVRFRAPLRPGDTVYIESRLESLLRTSKPPRAVVNCADTLLDSEGRVLCTYTRSALCDIAGTALYSGPGT